MEADQIETLTDKDIEYIVRADTVYDPKYLQNVGLFNEGLFFKDVLIEGDLTLTHQYKVDHFLTFQNVVFNQSLA